MISNVLYDAVAEIDRYLDDPDWDHTYTGDTRAELQALRTLMAAYAERLDTPTEHWRASQRDAVDLNPASAKNDAPAADSAAHRYPGVAQFIEFIDACARIQEAADSIGGRPGRKSDR